MTIAAVIPAIKFAGSSSPGTSGPFSLLKDGTPINFSSNSHIKVYRYDTTADAAPVLLVENTDYTLTGGPDAGSLTLTSPQTPLLAAERLLVYREQPATQPLDLSVGGSFGAVAFEARFDRIVEMLQEHSEKIGRALKMVTFGVDTVPELNLAAALGKIFYLSGTEAAPVWQTTSATFDVALVADALDEIALVAADLAGADTVGQVAAALSGAGLAGALPAIATGSITARTLADRFGEVFNVKDYGATGAGLVSDRAAFQLAMDAAFAANGTVYMPPGIYLIDDELEIGDGATTGRICIRGAGMRQTSLYVTPFGAAKKLFKSMNPDTDTRTTEWCTFEGFEIVGRNSGNSATFASIDHPIGIFLPYSVADVIRNVRGRGLGNTLTWTCSANNTRIYDVQAIACGSHYTQDDAASTGATFSLTATSDQVTASAAVFVADHVGRNFHVEGGGSLGGVTAAAFTISAVAMDGLSATLDRNAVATVAGKFGTFEGVRGSITSTDNTFTSEQAVFRSADVGRFIYIEGAGPSGGLLITTIASFTSSTVVELADPANTSVTNKFWYFTPSHFHGQLTADAADSRGLNDIQLQNCLAETCPGVSYILGPGVNIWLDNCKSHGLATVTRSGRDVRNMIWNSVRAGSCVGTEFDFGYNKSGGNILVCGDQGSVFIDNFTAGAIPENQPFIEISSTSSSTTVEIGSGHYYKALAYEPQFVNFTGSVTWATVFQSGKLRTRDIATIYDIGAPYSGKWFYDKRITLADDVATYFPTPFTQGHIVLTSSGSSEGGLIYVRTTGSPGAVARSVGADVQIATGALTNGTSDGTDGKMNISAVSGGIYIKNRMNGPRTVSWALLA